MLEKKSRDGIIAVLENIAKDSGKANDEDLSSISKTCQASLSPRRAAFYQSHLGNLKALIALGRGSLSPGEATGASARCRELARLLIDELGKEKEVKKEIVFLPYKAAMWDSMETIWRAAAQDKARCNAYVVPIPYAEKKPDQSLGEWKNEGGQFPKDVPIVDFQTIDLAKMHPDAIFIHNPYDDSNVVTTVDRRFYSSELRKCTDKLVYVPYFVAGNFLQKELCIAPGITNADYVIVESEDIKKKYEQNYLAGIPRDGKFLPLGSPKYEKLKNCKREDFDLPETWKKIIEGRKVLLYNTSVVSILARCSHFLRKLCYVFAACREQQEIALWWRPHPLAESTLRSLHPDIAAEYHKIEEQYKKEGWGIFDDTADVHRAIVWSDAYYGDGGSLLWLYKMTGKPILMENYYVHDRQEGDGWSTH